MQYDWSPIINCFCFRLRVVTSRSRSVPCIHTFCSRQGAWRFRHRSTANQQSATIWSASARFDQPNRSRSIYKQCGRYQSAKANIVRRSTRSVWHLTVSTGARSFVAGIMVVALTHIQRRRNVAVPSSASWEIRDRRLPKVSLVCLSVSRLAVHFNDAVRRWNFVAEFRIASIILARHQFSRRTTVSNSFIKIIVVPCVHTNLWNRLS